MQPYKSSIKKACSPIIFCNNIKSFTKNSGISKSYFYRAQNASVFQTQQNRQVEKYKEHAHTHTHTHIWI